MTADQRAEIGIRDELIRVSVGLEPLEQLKEEFSQVLEAIAA